MARAYDPAIQAVDPGARRIGEFSGNGGEQGSPLDGGESDSWGFPVPPRGESVSPYRVLALMLVLHGAHLLKRFVYRQALLDLARGACALERYRLRHGEFPESLSQVAPVADRPLWDLMSKEPLRYRRLEDGGWVLYSVGWNRRDDGGKAVIRGSRREFNVVSRKATGPGRCRAKKVWVTTSKLERALNRWNSRSQASGSPARASCTGSVASSRDGAIDK